MPLPKARISVRKVGTARGKPHYGSECLTCGAVLIVSHASKEAAREAGERHKENGCQHTLRYYSQVT